MGWKNVKEAFSITHQVTTSEDAVYIGSRFVHNLVTIDRRTGKLSADNTFSEFLDRNYPALITATPEDLIRLIETPDEFKASIPVYTFRDGEVISKLCETPGWPNNTHDGELMYENRFSTDRDQVIRWAKDDLKAWTGTLKRRIKDLENELADTQSKLTNANARAADLNAKYPSPEAVPENLSAELPLFGGCRVADFDIHGRAICEGNPSLKKGDWLFPKSNCTSEWCYDLPPKDGSEFLAYDPELVDPAFQPDGIVLAVWAEQVAQVAEDRFKDGFVGSVWNDSTDSWEAQVINPVCWKHKPKSPSDMERGHD